MRSTCLDCDLCTKVRLPTLLAGCDSVLIDTSCYLIGTPNFHSVLFYLLILHWQFQKEISLQFSLTPALLEGTQTQSIDLGSILVLCLTNRVNFFNIQAHYFWVSLNLPTSQVVKIELRKLGNSQAETRSASHRRCQQGLSSAGGHWWTVVPELRGL
jgi:hypothetical protein